MSMRQIIIVFLISMISACASAGNSPAGKLSKYSGSGTDIYFRIQSKLEKANELEMAFIKQWPGLSACFEQNAAADELDDLYLKANFLGFGRKGDFKSLRITELRPTSNELKNCVQAELEKIQLGKPGVGPGSIEMSMQPLGSKGGPALRFPYSKEERAIKK